MLTSCSRRAFFQSIAFAATLELPRVRGTRDREQLERKQAHRFRLRIDAAALANREVERIAREVGQRRAGVDAHFDLRFPRGEQRQPRHQPARTERRHHGDLHDAPAGPHALRRERDGAQVPRDLRVPRSARLGERKATALALRERDAEMGFEHAQLLAHGRGRHRQFVGGRAHRAQPRDGVEGTNGV